MRGFLGFRQDAAAIEAAFEAQKSGSGAIREGIVVTAGEAAKFDAYFANVVKLEQSKDRLMATYGDKFTWVHVNNNLEAPSVEVGITPSAIPAETEAFLRELPANWQVATRKAKNSHNKMKKVFDRLADDNDETSKATKNAAGPNYLRTEWKMWEEKFTVVVKKSETNAKAVEDNIKKVPGMEDAIVELGDDPNPAAGRLNSGGGAKAGTRINPTGCSSNVTLRDATNNRWVMLTAGHCPIDKGLTGPHTLTHSGQAIGSYRVGTAFYNVGPVGGVPGRLRNVAMYDLNAGQNSGLMLWVGVPIDSNPAARGHGFTDYMRGWVGTTVGQMVCFEGASALRDQAPYVNAGALRGSMQTVCGAAGAASTNGHATANWWGGGWGEGTCSGDSGGLLRIPSTNYAVGILSGVTPNRMDLAPSWGNPQNAFCGNNGFFFLIGDAVSLYLGITPQAVDGLAMVRNIKDAGGSCLGRPGGTHWGGVAITREGCSQDWRIIPVNEIVQAGGQPVGDDIYVIEHWGICASAGAGSVVQVGCSGSPWPATAKWSFSLLGNGFSLQSVSQPGQFMNPGPGNSVVLNGNAYEWSFG